MLSKDHLIECGWGQQIYNTHAHGTATRISVYCLIVIECCRFWNIIEEPDWKEIVECIDNSFKSCLTENGFSLVECNGHSKICNGHDVMTSNVMDTKVTQIYTFTPNYTNRINGLFD